MRADVLTRKKAGLILMLAKALKTTPEKALGLFYSTDTNRMLSDSRYGLHLMCSRSPLRDVLAELAAFRKINVSASAEFPVGKGKGCAQ